MREHRTLGLLLLTLTACSANVSSPGESDADAVTPTTAVVTFERVTTTSDARDQVRGATAARFVQTRTASAAVDERALKLVGAAFEAPPSFGCVALSDELDVAAGHALELADVGGLQVVQTAAPASAPARAFSLVPRQVPDPVGLVGGVLYYAPSVSPSESQVVPGSRYSVRAAGSPGVPAFELSGTSPLEVTDVRVMAPPSTNVNWSISWSTPDAARETGDIFFVDVVVARANGTNASTLRCAADAAGASIPGSVLGSIAGSGGQDEVTGTIAVHRVHREREVRARTSATNQRSPFESSELRFDFSRVVAFTRR